MEAAVGVFHHLKANLLGEAGEAGEGEEFPSEYSEDYNSSASRHFSGKVGSSVPGEGCPSACSNCLQVL